jgi:CHAT domain-containing protein
MNTVARPSRLVPLLAALFLACLAAGCAGMDGGLEAHLSGRYDDNITQYEGKLAKGEKLDALQRYILCDAYSNMRSYAKIFDCADQYQTALRERSWGPLMLEDGTPLSESLADIWRAQALLETGRGQEAAALMNKALEEMGKPGALGGFKTGLYARMLTLRGLAQSSVKDYNGARQTIKDLQDMTCGFVNMGPCNGERNKALTLVNVSLGQYREALATSDGSGMRVLWNINAALSLGTASYDKHLIPNEFIRVKVLYETGKTAEAKAGYERLLANPALSSSGTIYWSVLYDLGRMARAEGDGALAAKRLADAVGVIEAQRANINTDAAKIGFIGDKQAVYQELISLLVEQKRAGEALEFVERAKSRALVDLLAERQNLAAQSRNRTEALESLQVLAGLEQKYAVSSAPAEERGRLRSAMSSAAGELRRTAPELASLVTVSASGTAEIQAELAPDETLLEYYGQGDDLYVFAVTRGGVSALRLDGRGLERDVRALRETLGQAAGEAYLKPAQALFARLLAPVPGALERPRLVIVGHGPLHYLPWAALHDGRQFLVDRVSVQQLPSASVMRFLAARKAAAARDMLLLGNPDLGDARMDLPGAEAETRAIRAIWPQATVLTRRAATKSALTRTGELFRVIHVAAHGEFVSDQPLDSRLLLAPEAGDDGRLTAGDLYGLRLNADLVTLSACETGLGKVLSGDDVIGLTRGFLYAGANSIVASLWPVSDEETSFLMVRLYGNLKTMPKADALRQAQLETKRRYAHPFFWSAFQLTGMGR